MMYQVLKSATGLEVGESYSLEDLAKKGDVANMLRKKIVQPVGFLSLGEPMTDSEAARQIQELQEKLESMEAERDAARAEVKKLSDDNKALRAGHAEGHRQLTEALELIPVLEAEIADLKAGRVPATA